MNIKNKLYKMAGIISIGVLMLSFCGMLGARELTVTASSGFLLSNLSIIIAVLTGILLLTVWITAASTATAISAPIEMMAAAAERVANGDLTASFDAGDGEIGRLAGNIGAITETLQSLNRDVGEMYTELSKKGNNGAKITAAYKGSFKDIASNINSMNDSLNRDITILLDIIRKYTNGDFNGKVGVMPGGKAEISETVNELQTSLYGSANELKKAINAAAKGNFSDRIDISVFKGEWREIADLFNKLLAGVSAPLNETAETLNKMAEGDFKAANIGGRQEGDVFNLINAANAARTSLSRHIGDIASALSAIASKNGRIAVQNEFKGDFAPIKASLTEIIDSMEKTVVPVRTAASLASSSTSKPPFNRYAQPSTASSPARPAATDTAARTVPRGTAASNQLSGASSVKMTSSDSAAAQAIYDSKDFGKYT